MGWDGMVGSRSCITSQRWRLFLGKTREPHYYVGRRRGIRRKTRNRSRDEGCTTGKGGGEDKEIRERMSDSTRVGEDF